VKYTYILILLLFISAFTTPVNNYAQQQEFKVYLKQRLEESISANAQGSQTGSLSMYMSLQTTYNMTITSERVKGEVTLECLSYSIDVSSDSTRTSTIVSDSECNQMFRSYLTPIKIDRSIQDYYGQAYYSSIQQLQQFLYTPLYIPGLLSIDINIEFNGFKTYKGYKVAEYSISFSARYTGDTNISISGKGTEYIYVGLPVVLYGEAEINIEFKSSEGNGSGSIKVKIETLEADLPVETPYGYVKHDKYTILAAGLPGSKIVVKGDRGGKTITARNEGNATGYVTIIYSTPSSSLSSIDLRQGSSGVVNALNQEIRVYVLNPGEERNITLPFELVDSVNFATSYTSEFDWLILLIVIAIIVIIVLIPIYLIIKLRKKSAVAPSPISELPPSPTPQQPPPPA